MTKSYLVFNRLSPGQARSRAIKEFLKPGKYLNLPYVKQVLQQARQDGKFVLILHRGSDAILRATAGAIKEVRNTNELQISVKLSDTESLTPLALVNFVDEDLITSGIITRDEYCDLFPPTVDLIKHSRVPLNLKAELLERDTKMMSALKEEEKAPKDIEEEPVELRLGFCIQKPVFIRPFTEEDLRFGLK